MAWASILYALWLFLPAYVANMSPVFTSKLLPRWGQPIDGGRMHADGQRMLGDGKTWRGLIGGGFFAAATATIMAAIAGTQGGFFGEWDFGYQGGFDGCEAGICNPSTPLWAVALFGFVVGVFALAGDALESYAKRRTGRERGAPWIPFDQLDFVVFGLAGMVLASPLLDGGWLLDALLHDWVILTTIVVGTPALHLTINRIGFWLKLKEVPW